MNASHAPRFSGTKISSRSPIWMPPVAGLRQACYDRGIEPGDRVAVGLPNSPELVIAVLGVLRSGAVLVPLNPAYTSDELGYVVNDCGASLAITHAEQVERMCAARTANARGH